MGVIIMHPILFDQDERDLTGCVLYYNFLDDRSESTAHDLTGVYGNSGAINGATIQPDGLKFNGVDNFINIADDFVTDEFTVTIMFKIPVDYPADTRFFFSTGDYNNATGNNGLHVYIDLSKRIRFRVTTDILQDSSVVPIVVDTFYHVVFTKSGATGRLYLDGVEKTSRTDLNTVSDSSLNVTRIGSTTPGLRFFPGTIAEVAIFNRALSAGEVKDWSDRALVVL